MAIFFSSSKTSTILDRASSLIPLSLLQLQVDHHVNEFVEQATDARTLGAMVGAGMAYRFARLGTIAAAASLLPEGNALASLFTRGTSYTIALASESATFAALNRGFRHLEGQTLQESFGKEFLNSAVSLGSLKFFGKLGEGQNPLFQHLLVDTGMVASHLLAAFAHLEEKPEGDLFSQLLQAEAMNWQMKAGMGLVHEAFPRLGPSERSMDLFLRAREFDLSNRTHSYPFHFQRFAAGAGIGRPKLEASSPPDFAEKLIDPISLSEGGKRGTTKKTPLPSPGKPSLKLLPSNRLRIDGLIQ